MVGEKVKINDAFSIRKGKKVEEKIAGKFNYITIENLHSKHDSKFTDDSGVFVDESDTLIAWDGANAGLVGVGFKGVIGSTLAQIKMKSTFQHKLDPRYFYRYLYSNFELIKSKRTGATIPHVNGAELKAMQIPLPPLATQKAIAEKLDKADALRKKDQQLLKLYDELAQSVFIEMFGDPVRNERGWEEMNLSLLGTLERGKSKHRPRNAPELLGGKYPLIQTGEVANSGGYITSYSQTYSEIGLKQSRLWNAGALCITIAANIAKTGILKIDACFPDSIVGFIPNEKSNVEFIQFWFSFFQKILEDQAPESAQKNINLEILRNLTVINPPLPLQQKFAIIIENIEAQKVLLSKQAAESENLFQSLLQESFS